MRQKASELPVVGIGGVAAPERGSDEPRNILLIGTDSTAGISSKEPIAKGRDSGENLADVIMILRVDPKANTADLLSIPRDSWLPVAPRWSNSKINSAMPAGGPANVIATIKHDFGISISNYAQVNFKGFRDVVQVLGGVPIYLNTPVKDQTTGLYLVKTGCITVDPNQALAYARSRHMLYEIDGHWKGDPTGDLGRINRQQEFMRRVAQRAIEKGLRNPATALGLINAGLKSVIVDSEFKVGQIQDLIERFRSFSVDKLKTYQLPTTSGGSSVISYQDVVWKDAEPILDIFRGTASSLLVTPQQVIVDVPAASPNSAALVAGFEKAGFDADAVQYGTAKAASSTVVRYGPKGSGAAQLVARSLDGNTTFQYQSDLPGQRVEVIPGSGLTSLRSSPRDASLVPAPTTPLGRGLGTTSSSTSSSTPDVTSQTTTTLKKTSKKSALTTSTTTTSTIFETTTTASSSPVTSSGSTDTLPSTSAPTTTAAIGFLPTDPVASAKCGG